MPFKTAPALECLLLNISSTVCFPIRTALLRLVPGSTFPAALQRERQLRSSAFPNQTDNQSLRCFSRTSKNYSFSRLVPSLLHGGRSSLVCLIVICLLPTYYAQLCLSRLHQHLSPFCPIFQAQYAPPSAERC